MVLLAAGRYHVYLSMYARYNSLSLFQAFCCHHLQAEGSSAESISALAKVDTVKQRMEAAYETLQVKKNRGSSMF